MGTAVVKHGGVDVYAYYNIGFAIAVTGPKTYQLGVHFE
jgi:hypothetical protein